MEINNGVNLHIIKNDIFTTVTIAILLRQPLKKENVSDNVLIASMFKRGTQRLKKQKEINTFLDELYGTDIESYIMKKGNEQIITLYCETANKDNNVEKIFRFLMEIIFEPYMENGCFDEKYFEEEKENAINFLEDKLNDKKAFAKEKCVELMYYDDEIGICADGYKEDFEKADRKRVFEKYIDIIKNSEIEILVNGEINKVEKEKIEKMCKERFSFKRNFDKKTFKINKRLEKTVKDRKIKMNVEQSRICIGYKTKILPESDDIYTLFVANEIFGGGGNSKLFANVREKKGLCYYINSTVLRFTGDIIVESGIKKEDLKEIEKSVNEEINKIKKGDFSEKELKNAISVVKKRYLLLNDSASSQMDFYTNNIILKTNNDCEEIIAKIDLITKDKVGECMNNIDESAKIFLCKG